MKLTALLLAAALLAPSPAWSQNCTRGKRCGNTCIAVNKTCHTATESETDPSVAAAAGIAGGIILLAVIIYAVSHSTPSSYDDGYSLTVDENGGQVGYRWEF